MLANWSLGAPPATVMDAAIGDLGKGTATLSHDAIVNSIAVKSGSALTIDSGNTLTKISGTKLNPADVSSPYSGNHGEININTGATLDAGDGSTAVTFTNNGALNIGVNTSNGAIGDFTYGSAAKLTFNGAGQIHLGSQHNATTSEGDISGGYKIVNVDNAISGADLISGQYIDNQAKGVITADQTGGNELALVATRLFTNEGALAVTDRARLTLGADGATETLTNTGDVYVGSDGVATGMRSDLAIRGKYTVNGAGSIHLLGDGSRIVSDGAAASTLFNRSEILAVADSQIGDAGVYASANGLRLVNSGSVVVLGQQNTLTLNTGSNRINDGGGRRPRHRLGCRNRRLSLHWQGRNDPFRVRQEHGLRLRDKQSRRHCDRFAGDRRACGRAGPRQRQLEHDHLRRRLGQHRRRLRDFHGRRHSQGLARLREPDGFAGDCDRWRRHDHGGRQVESNHRRHGWRRGQDWRFWQSDHHERRAGDYHGRGKRDLVAGKVHDHAGRHNCDRHRHGGWLARL